MSNNANKRPALDDVAASCKKVLKNLKIRTVSTTAAALVLGTVSLCAAAVMNNEEAAIAMTASPSVNGEAVVCEMPAKEYDVTIAVDGRNIDVRCAGNVENALEAADVEICDDDLINIGLSEPLGSGTEIIINRVNIVEEVQVEVIEYATKYQEDDELLVGYTETVVDGEEGEVETTFRHVYVDGELVSSDVIDEDITQPVDEVIAIGTMEEPVPIYDEAVPAGWTPYSEEVELDENGVPVNYVDVITGEATAYTASAGAITSTGKTAQVGYVAVDPKVIPYGTKLYIVSVDGTRTYGYAVAEDTGGAMRSGRVLVDLYMDTESECYNWGRRDVNVYILE
ncbi:MAG: G5 domain-containing protein [Oscillospiraceae bacterium]|nr:G5 domain-containing protein [Oscillospiraceae bacterium]